MSPTARLRPLASILPRGTHPPRLKLVLAQAQAHFTTSSPQRRISVPAFFPRFLQPATYLPAYYGSGNNRSRKSWPEFFDPAKPWNPATFFIWIFLLIGSQGIQLIALKKQREEAMRKADARLAQLHDVLGRLQRGETVDEAALQLGAGDEREEKAWEDVLREIEEEDQAWQRKRSNNKKAADPDTLREEGVVGAAGEGAVREARGNARKEESMVLPLEKQAKSAEDYEYY